MSRSASWEHFPHNADIGVRGIGPTLASAFEQAALALTAIVVEPNTVEVRQQVAFHCQAPDVELLLYDWLNLVIHEMAVRQLLFSRFCVELEDDELRATACGEPVDRARHQPSVEPKGATMTELRVVHDDAQDVWLAQCIIDV